MMTHSTVEAPFSSDRRLLTRSQVAGEHLEYAQHLEHDLSFP